MSKTATPHIGRKIERIRTIRGMKQETLAAELGISQGTLSKIEQSENVEDEKLEEIAKVLGVSAEAIKNFDEDATINIIATNCNDQSASVNYYCNFNPIEKMVELYERLLQSEREKIAMLEKQVNKK